ncbi:MAG: IstB-like ATP-binding domain-containing protein [Bradyrhizobium sp.]|uniref:ATP-binding protein n=1 Tax=Bradyrhizobium sp. TaxID=376 RepID=UPI001C285739|nr:ATP-binding protein [Bradyrhizobium sp.]MBU6461129.1 IstB-like ATP-binding domain-containing protein [Pseudomonadota bacterium]MDE2066205.1 IstB-like ATP-binding domain-containing protein [Bradyrhizobium sp.]MDE2472645.1 IstB-like ATP-binding domain-containing protein [Bradyrhizobium sp.]
MQALGLAGMAAAYRQLAEQDHGTALSQEEWLGLMLDREAAMRADRRLTDRLASAKLRFVDACIEDIDFTSSRGLDRRCRTTAPGDTRSAISARLSSSARRD